MTEQNQLPLMPARAALNGTLQAVTELEAGSAVAFHLQGDREMYTEENLTKVSELK